MPYTKLDDKWRSNPKLLEAAADPDGGDSAIAMWVAAVSYCNEHLTDGRIRRSAVPTFVRNRKPFRVADALVRAGCWEVDGEDFRVHDFLDWNESREQVLRSRSAAKLRKAAHVAKKERANSRQETESVTPFRTRSSRVPGRDPSVSGTLPSPLLSSPLRSREEEQTPCMSPAGDSPPEPPDPPPESAPAAPRTKPAKVQPSREPKAHERYAEAYAAGMREASGQPFSQPRGKADLVEMATTYARIPGGAAIVGAELLTWFRETAAAYRLACPNGQFQGGYDPAHCLRWLNAGRPDDRGRVFGRPNMRQPPAASEPAWTPQDGSQARAILTATEEEWAAMCAEREGTGT